MLETKRTPPYTTLNKGSLKRALTNDRLNCCDKIMPQSSSTEFLCKQLERNQIKRFRIGFSESARTIRDYLQLCKAFRRNTSLKVVQIGWEVPQAVLFKILYQVAGLPLVESLTLACYSNIPEQLLQMLVSKPTLKRLELRNITVGSHYGGSLSPCKERALATSKGNVLVKDLYQNVSVLAPNYFSDSIESLHLVACEMDDDDINRICEWTRMRTRTHPLDELSLAHSPGITPQGLETLFQRAVCRRLDLTGCGLMESDASVIARNLAQSSTIEDLVLARNF